MGWKPNIFKHFNWKSHNRLSLLDFVESLLAFVHSSCQGLMLNSHLNLCLPSCPGIFYFSNIQQLAWIFQLLRGLKVWFPLSVHWHSCHTWVPHFLIPQQKSVNLIIGFTLSMSCPKDHSTMLHVVQCLKTVASSFL